MFWRFGGYAVASTIDNILDRGDFALEELLDESDLIQELKQHNAKLVEYLRDQDVLKRLLEYVVAPKLEPVAAAENEDDAEDENQKGISLPFTRPRASSRATDASNDDSAVEKKRNRYAFVAAEILSSDNWSIFEALMESKDLLREFWQFLKRPAPLDPLQASYFTKVNESLFDRKTEEMIDLLKSLDNAVPDMLKHVDCPMVMDLLLRIISLERTEAGHGIVEWLYTQDVMPSLLSFLGPEHGWATQTSAADFIKAIITVSANASQNEQTCIGPNELTRQLVSRPCVEQLINYMLGGGNPLTCGVGIVIEVIRKNNSDYDPEATEPNSTPSARDPIYLGTLLRMFADHIPDFMRLIMNAPAQKERFTSTFGDHIEPLGFDRFKTCELMAELLHCSNMGLLNEVGAEEVIAQRDAQRQLLRAQGQLVPVREQEPPSAAEDITMRAAHSSPADTGRKLGVTNTSVDDDGFEEVTHTTDEDITHGIEELPEGSLPGPTSSFLDKDEDDFVDEPLRSPRLRVRDHHNPMEDTAPIKFDDPNLVVAPLSPTKKASVPIRTASASEGQNDDGNKTEETTVNKEGSDSDLKPSEDAQVEIRGGSDKPVAPEEMSPHPDDTPAPLFSASPRTTDLSEPSQDTISKEEQAETSQMSTGGEQSDPDATIAHDASEADKKHEPVVGDYLKMQFVEYKVVPTILSFFFSYPWNNFLHNVVYDIVQQVFNGPMKDSYNHKLAISLFETADITNQIIGGQLTSEKSENERKTRMGYMGHLTLIAEEVVKFTERHETEVLTESILEKVMARDWIEYVEGPLSATRTRDNAVLGGVRPESLMGRSGSGMSGVGLSALGSLGLSGGSNALAEAGLNGGQDVADSSGGNGIGPFAISAGTLMSGFGSSSDEDEDEEQDNEENVNNEFRAYTDPLNANLSNSMNPPSIPPPPPPPPPLNIPPSRARLQLAARLAMNKRNAEAAANGGQEGGSAQADNSTGSGTFSLPDESVSDSLRNPFEDEEDEDEDNDGNGSGSDDGEPDNTAHNGLGGSTWNRGSWWRGMVPGGQKNKSRGDSQDAERFGDGRDSESDDGADGGEVVDDIDDEEFGDFAMPEVEGNAQDSEQSPTSGRTVSGIDPAREKILVKPLPVHPSKSGSPFGNLWPFSTPGFGKKDDREVTTSSTGEQGSERQKENANPRSGVPITEEPEELDAVMEDLVIGEDGKKINRAVEAKRRTSIEDPDDDEAEEIFVSRPTGAR
ncbi:SIT4 phosphatase-associated domain-containing protein [Neurospora intermedia]|uniref:SIT4 phosphatase-associated domain-containing protein n=1 Tax=Neurospora intermedia TaxID=5142 RepID=A0ABR3D6R0_NEUIN